MWHRGFSDVIAPAITSVGLIAAGRRAGSREAASPA
jgi:hypothetical protein